MNDPRIPSDAAKAALRDAFRAIVPAAPEAALDALAEAAAQTDAFGPYAQGRPQLALGIVREVMHGPVGMVIARQFPGRAPAQDQPPEGATLAQRMSWARERDRRS